MVVLICFFWGVGTRMGNHRMALAGFKPRTQWDDFGFSSQRWEPLTQNGQLATSNHGDSNGMSTKHSLLHLCFFFHGVSSI